jgi:hypothetical protein
MAVITIAQQIIKVFHPVGGIDQLEAFIGVLGIYSNRAGQKEQQDHELYLHNTQFYNFTGRFSTCYTLAEVMKMKKHIGMFVLFAVLLSICVSAAEAQSKIIRKTVKKVVTPEIAPVQPPKVEPSPEVVSEEVPPPPPPPTDYDVKPVEEDKGLLGWGWDADAGGKLLYGSILLAGRGDLVFADPLLLGEKIGLAEDAVEYRVGLGGVISDKLKSIPLFADAVVYLKEGSLMGMDPYIGTGLIYNLYGTGRVSGGLGGQVYLGILADLGFEQRTGICVGYASYKVGNILSDSGIFVTIAQPIKL